MKSLFEQMGGTYTLQGDYYFPNLSLPAEKNKPIGIWGQRHLRYIQHHRKVFYTNLLTSGRMNSYLADIDKQAEELFLRLVKQMAGSNFNETKANMKVVKACNVFKREIEG